jgi:L-alanine-DL-glutamate epimerase-like enolase superfamily enzyme
LSHAATALASWPLLRSRELRAAEAGPLAEHRVVAIETRSVPLPWPRLVGRNAKLDVHGRGPTVLAVVLRTDRGALGWGEALEGAKSIEKVRPTCIGKPVAELIAPAVGILRPELRPLDVALHDLAGVILQQPVWRMLGAATPRLFPIYSGMIYFDDLTPEGNPPGIEQVLKNCAADRELGYRQLKVKIGRGNRWMSPEAGLQCDIDVVRAIARAFPDCQLLVDGNDGLSVEQFLRFLDGIGEIPLVWIEEPFVEDERKWRMVYEWTRANGRAETLLADGEQHNDYPLLERLETAGVLQVRLNDILGHGFTAWRQLMPQLITRKTQASPHCWGSGLKTIYTAHLLAALGNAPTIEGVTCSHEHVDFGGNVIRDGKQLVSDQPGFGLTLRA